MGIACTFQPLKEAIARGRRGSACRGGFRTETRLAYEFVNWYLSRLGRCLSQSPGLLFRRPLHRQGQHDARRMGLLMEGKAAVAMSRRPTGTVLEKAAPSVTAGPMTTAWAPLPAGTPSWTRTITWSASGMNSSPPDAISGLAVLNRAASPFQVTEIGLSMVQERKSFVACFRPRR